MRTDAELNEAYKVLAEFLLKCVFVPFTVATILIPIFVVLHLIFKSR